MDENSNTDLVLWKVREAAEFLRCTPDAMYKMVEDRKIPYLRIGRRILFDASELRAWLEQRRVGVK